MLCESGLHLDFLCGLCRSVLNAVRCVTWNLCVRALLQSHDCFNVVLEYFVFKVQLKQLNCFWQLEDILHLIPKANTSAAIAAACLVSEVAVYTLQHASLCGIHSTLRTH